MESIGGKNRIEWLDTARGIGIIFVVLGHIGFGRFNQWIYSFHLPLFVFISGMLFNPNTSALNLIKKRIKTLLIPYFCFGLIILLEEMITFSKINSDFIISFIKDLLIQKRFRFVWFLTFLFVIELFYLALHKAIKNKIVFGIVVFAFSIVVFEYNLLFKKAFIWNADASAFMLPIFYLGTLASNIIDKIEIILKKYKWLLIICGLVISLISVFLFNNTLELFDMNFGIPIINFISALSGIVFVLTISCLIHNPVLKYVGENSLSYYLTHMCISFPISNKIMSMIGVSLNANSSFLYTNAYKLFFLVLVISLCTATDYLIKKIKCNFIIGK